MRYEQVVRALFLRPTPGQDAACRELEKRGFTFAVDYGLDNAEAVVAGMDAAFQSGCLYDWLARRGMWL